MDHSDIHHKRLIHSNALEKATEFTIVAFTNGIASLRHFLNFDIIWERVVGVTEGL